jgi:hypothetical protein
MERVVHVLYFCGAITKLILASDSSTLLKTLHCSFQVGQEDNPASFLKMFPWVAL